MKKQILFLVLGAMVGLVSCSSYKDCASTTISMEEIGVGMKKDAVVAKFGQPFSFDMRVSGNDTITVLSYKSPKAVANKEFVVTTVLRFVNDNLNSISQRDFFVPDNVIYCDTTKVAL